MTGHGRRRRIEQEINARKKRTDNAEARRPEPDPEVSTRCRLAEAMTHAGAPNELIDKALRGEYDEYSGDAVMPLVMLMDDLRQAGQPSCPVPEGR